MKKRFSPFKKGLIFILCLMIITTLTGCYKIERLKNMIVPENNDSAAPAVVETEPPVSPEEESDDHNYSADSDEMPLETNAPESEIPDSSSDEASDAGVAAGDQAITAEGRNVLLLNADTGDVVFEKNSDEKIAPASTTKMLTALTALAYCSEDETITVGEEIERITEDASRAWLTIGDELTVKQMLVALMLPSGNDAAYSLAVYTGRKLSDDPNMSIDEAVAVFIDAMNEKAAEAGADSSHFLAPDGYDVEGQYTTAGDLAKIAAAYMANPTLAEIAGSERISDTWVSGKEVTYENTNAMLFPGSPYYSEHVTGLKTGNSDAAGACLVASASLQDQNYICVVMGSTDAGRFEESLKLFNSITE